MAMFTANATIDGVKVPATANVEVGESIEDAIELYGEPCVYDLYNRGATLAVQQRIGALLRQGNDPKAIPKAMESFRLDQRASRAKKSVEEKVSDLFEGLSKDQIQEVLANMGLQK